MSGHRKWSQIRRSRTAEQEARLAAGVAAIHLAMRLAEVREGRSLTQGDVAGRMGVSQPHIAQVEARDDAYLSTLIRYVHALGGDLRIQAVFPGEEPIEIALDDPPRERMSAEASATA